MSAHRPFRIGVLTLSDKGSKGQRIDESGPVVDELLAPVGEVVHVAILPDDVELIVALLTAWADEEGLDLIVTTGGTGLSPRDVTPQATLQAIDYEIPGMAEAMRMKSLQKTPHAMVSRAVVGVRKIQQGNPTRPPTTFLTRENGDVPALFDRVLRYLVRQGCLDADDAEQMKQALAALEQGPMDEDELAWMRRVGDHIYGSSRAAGLMDGK